MTISTTIENWCRFHQHQHHQNQCEQLCSSKQCKLQLLTPSLKEDPGIACTQAARFCFFPPNDPHGSGQKATPTSSQQLAQRNERRPSLFSMTFIQIFPLAQETNDPTQKNEGFVLLRHQDV